MLRRYFALNTFQYIGTDGRLSFDDLVRDPYATLASACLMVSATGLIQIVADKLGDRFGKGDKQQRAG